MFIELTEQFQYSQEKIFLILILTRRLLRQELTFIWNR